MGIFQEWLKKRIDEGMPMNWKPSAPFLGDPITSALIKIERGIDNMPFNGNFTGADIIRTQFGLTDQEFAKLKEFRLFKKTEQGVNINYDAYVKLYTSLLQAPPSFKSSIPKPVLGIPSQQSRRIP